MQEIPELDPVFFDGVFEIGRRVASCPHVAVCQREFFEKGERTRKPEQASWQLANIPSPDFIGSKYRGLVIIGSNPGIANLGVHDRNDAKMFALQKRIALGDKEAFAELMQFLPTSMQHWKQMVDTDGRRRLDYDIEEVAYINIVKCGSGPPGSDSQQLFKETKILSRCWENHTLNLLEILRPTHIVALWKPVIPVLRRLGFNVDEKVVGSHNGAHHLARDVKYAEARLVFDSYYKRR